ncbi:MAG: HAD-IIB family hydrolase [Sphingomonas fennica]
MRILHLALGGCLKGPPVSFGVTADTGGHIAYVVDAAIAQGAAEGVTAVTIVTRLIEDARLGPAYAVMEEAVAPTVAIRRIATADRRYLEKEALGADLPAFTAAFLDDLAASPALPDVIHAHFADAAAVAAAARARFGIPYVYTPHALGIDKRAQADAADAALDARIEAERRAIAGADAILVSTADEADRQVAAYRVAGAAGRVHCLPPGVPHHAEGGASHAACAGIDALLANPAKPILLAIARPVAKKNLAALLRAYSGCPALIEAANLVILAGRHPGGSGSAEEQAVLAELHALAAAPHLAGCVALPPTHGTGDVAALYARAAAGGLFVNPALHEPFGLTLIEAAAAGVPVVATANGGPADIVGTLGHGLLVDPHDDAAIAAACHALIGNPALHARCAAAGRAGIGRYSWGAYAAGSVDIYAHLDRRPRLFVSDIDNTLTGCPAGARAFAEWHAARSMPFAVATGRSFAMARAILAEWRLPLPDAYIVDVGTRLMLAKGDGWEECADYAAAIDRDWDRAAVAAALARLPLRPQPAETAGPHKISFFGGEGDAAAIRLTLAEAGLAARVVFSHGRLIDVLAPHAGKAAAIAALAARHGLSPADCIAAGDSGNDIDMLEACGHAIVVGNAGAELAGLARRPGLNRVAGHHATGVMEGLAAIGLAQAPRTAVAA